MEITARGRCTKLSRQEVIEAVEFFYSILIPSKRSRKKTRVVIYLKPMPWKLHGQTHTMRGHQQGRNPRAFGILINSRLSKRKQLQALAHELVHVKQFAKNELGCSESRKGQTFTRWKRSTVNETKRDYYELPWEIEAFGREYGLYKRYTKFVKDSHEVVMIRVKNST
jgi:hypothetical protein